MAPNTFMSFVSWVEDHTIATFILGFFGLGFLSVLAEFLKGVSLGLQVKLAYIFLFLSAWLVAAKIGDPLYFLVFVIGTLTALAEIIGKFKDDPLKALKTWQAILYLAFNGVIASFALYVLKIFGVPASSPQDNLKIGAAAGLGAMALMRSKLFDVKVGEQSISFGPEQIVKVFFDYMERDIDRIRAQSRMGFVRDIMNNLKFSAIVGRTKTMLQSSTRLSKEDQASLLNRIKEINDDGGIVDVDKSLRLGFLLYEYMGEEFVAKLYDNPEEEWKVRAKIQDEPRFISPKLIPQFLESKKLYFSYGKNMSTANFMITIGHPLREKASFLENTQPKAARLVGYKLVFMRPSADGTHSLASIMKTGSDKDVVEGVLYQVVEETLKFIDARRQNSRRESVTVDIDNDHKGRGVSAITYVATEVADGMLPLKGDLNTMILGAKEHNLSSAYIATLEMTPSREYEMPVTTRG